MSVSILVVDDEADVAELFRQQFRRETRQRGCAFHYATSGAEALDWLAREIERHRNRLGVEPVSAWHETARRGRRRRGARAVGVVRPGGMMRGRRGVFVRGPLARRARA